MAFSYKEDSEIAKHDGPALSPSSRHDHGIESSGSSSDDSLDDNYEVYKATADVEVDEAEARKVVRKIDARVVPVLFVTYFLQYLDKSESSTLIAPPKSTDLRCAAGQETNISPLP